ncbi:MAG: T9SS type B sorting domain-containing protein [Salibacteraceae bacterium]
MLKAMVQEDNDFWAERSLEFSDLRLEVDLEQEPPVYFWKDQFGHLVRIPKYFFLGADSSTTSFIIEGLEHYSENQLFIYDKFGILVGQWSLYNNTWKGATTDGSFLPSDRYFFRLSLPPIQEALRGFFYLIRLDE